MMAVLLVVAVALGADAGLHPILEPAFQQQMNAASNSVLTPSDDIELLVDGKESYPERWRMLENAKKSIHFSTMYIFHDDTTEKLGDLLIQKKKEGVDVKLIVNGVYRFGNLPFYRRMKKHGVEVKLYSSVSDVLLHSPLRFWRRHLHDKYLVVDGAEAITGGMNWSKRYESGGTDAKVAWRDTDLYVRGTQAAVVEMEFQKRWHRDEAPAVYEEKRAELAGMYARLVYPGDRAYSDFLTPDAAAPFGWRVKGLTRFLYQQPFEDGQVAYMTNFYRAMIDKAQKHVWWQSISIRPAPIQKQALLAAAARGVDVILMTNSKRNMCMIPIGGWPLYDLTQSEYRELLEGGIRIFEYSGAAPMHAKGFLVDDVVAIIGSYNATFTAEKYYTESAFAVYDTDVVGDVHQMFSDDFAHCKEVTLADLPPLEPHPLVAGVVQIGAAPEPRAN